MDTKEFHVCPSCGQIKLDLNPESPNFEEHVFQLIKSISISANQKIKEENAIGKLFERYNNNPSYVKAIEYFEELRGKVESAKSLPELLALKDMIRDSEIRVKDALRRTFEQQRSELSGKVNLRIQEMLGEDEG